MTMEEKEAQVARAICSVYFGDVVTHGDARCCQRGGTDGCCYESLLPVARAAIDAVDRANKRMSEKVG